MEEANNQQQHIVMLPYMAHGHLNPFLALAHALHRRFRLTVTIATTPLNVRYLRAAAAAAYPDTPHIHFAELPFTAADHELPPDVENTEALPLTQIIKLFRASVALDTPFRSLLRSISVRDGRPPLCVISDIFVGWANAAASDAGTVNVTFTTGGAYGTAAYVSIWRHLPHRKTDGNEFTVPGFPDSHRFHKTYLHYFLRSADGTDPWSEYFQHQIEQSQNSAGWLCNTAAEIEQLGLDVLKKCTHTSVWCIGPLLPPSMIGRQVGCATGQRTEKEFGMSPDKCLRWLDLQPKKSVIYISFGSQNTISPSQMMALAMGLEDGDTPFIWVIRPPLGFDVRGEFRSEWLPKGFEERMANKKQGLLIRGWAPQVEILCHESTGAFLSHCGWNSTVESLSQGVPMIGWPLAGEQGHNCKMLVEELGVCVVLTTGVESEISRENVKRVIEMVAGGGREAEEMNEKAGKIGEMIRAAVSEEGSSAKAMEDFVSTILARNRSAT